VAVINHPFYIIILNFFKSILVGLSKFIFIIIEILD
jgi:hypothetical protein